MMKNNYVFTTEGMDMGIAEFKERETWERGTRICGLATSKL